jgi:hypothetical protein
MRGATHVFSSSWVAMNHFDWLITKKLPKLDVSIGGWSAFPLDEKEKNFGQSIWDKSVRTYWGTCWELEKPLGNKQNKKYSSPPNPNLGSLELK